MNNIAKEELLRCPSCHRNLVNQKGYLLCGTCYKKYPNNDITDFIQNISDKTPIDNLSRWENNYSRINNNSIDHNPAWKEGFRYLDKFLKPKAGKVSLEVGCGVGWGSLHMASKNVTPVCLDFSKNALIKTKEIFNRSNKVGYFIRGDISNLPFNDAVFDYVFAGGTLEHFRDSAATLAEIHRVMKKDGRIFTTVPVISLSMLTYGQIQGNIPNIPILRQLLDTFHFKLLNGKLAKNGFELSFTMNQITKLFSKAGFGSLEVDYFDIPHEIRYIKNRKIKEFFNKLSKNRLFWPMIYIYGEK